MKSDKEKYLAGRDSYFKKMDLMSRAVIDMMIDIREFYTHRERINDRRILIDLEKKVPIASEVIMLLPMIVSEYFRVAPILKVYGKQTWSDRIKIKKAKRSQNEQLTIF